MGGHIWRRSCGLGIGDAYPSLGPEIQPVLGGIMVRCNWRGVDQSGWIHAGWRCLDSQGESLAQFSGRSWHPSSFIGDYLPPVPLSVGSRKFKHRNRVSPINSVSFSTRSIGFDFLYPSRYN